LGLGSDSLVYSLLGKHEKTGGSLQLSIYLYKKPVVRIHEIWGWIRIRIRGSIPLTNGS
jgi:hypothetical protein